MADGRIKIAVEVDGKQVNIAADSLDGLGSSAKNAGKWSEEVANGLKETGNESTKADKGIKKLATSLGLVAIGAAAFKVLSASMDDAIKRFDTLNKFPKVLQSLGVSAEDSKKSMNKLSDGIDGLPTKLDDIASNAQRMYTSFGDMDKATDSALALNNALLGSGSSAGDAQRGTEQYLKVLQTGKMELDTWNTLSETMDVALVKVADSFGYTGRSAKQDLYKALQDGHVTIDQFNDKLIELGTGTGELAELAKTNSLGMATSLENLKGAFSRGIAGILESLNTLSKDATGKEIAQNIDSLKVVINAAFKAMGKAIKIVTPLVKVFASAVRAAISVVKALSPVIAGLVTAYTALTIIDKVRNSMKKANAMFKVAQASKTGLTFVTKAHTVALATDLKMTQADTVAMIAQTGAVKLGALVMGVMTKEIGLLAAAKLIAAAAAHTLNVALGALLWPILIVVAAIGAVVTVVAALKKGFNKTSEEGEKLSKEVDALSESTESLSKSVEDSAKAYKDNQRSIKASADASGQLADKVSDLAKKENKSAGEKRLLSGYVEELNGQVAGLNLTYDEEADKLNVSNDAIKARIDAIKEQALEQVAMERLTELLNEQAEAELKLAETNVLREQWNQKLKDGTVQYTEYRKATKELDEQEEELNETIAELGEQATATETAMTTAMENTAEASNASADSMIIDFENLEGAQKEAFDSMKESYMSLLDVATDAFDEIDMETEHTMESMIETMENNQKVVAEWGENQAKLMEWAGKNGYDSFIPYIENMGIDSAAELAVMANASEDELILFAETLDKGGSTAGSSLKTSLGGEFDEVIDQAVDFVDRTSSTLKGQIKNANFDDIGEMMPEGAVRGFKKGTPKVEEASKDMAKGAEDAAKKEAGIRSPSTVFTGIGENMTDGLALGINDGTDTVISAVGKVLTGSIEEFEDVNASYYDIGESAMDGLNDGLNAKSEEVMATAKRIAKSVARTLRAAFKIGSPSKVMRDDVGRWIPEGLIKGIERTAPKLYKTLDNMASTMVQVTTPEMALGTHRMAYAGGISNNSNFTTKTDKSRKMENKITINTNDSGAKEMERTLRRLQFGF